MAKFLKIILGIVGVIVVIFAAGAAYLMFAFDPNDYRGEIAEAVKEKTGRELALTGDLKLSVFPWLGIRIGQASLSNAPGFGTAPFAEVGEIEARLKLLPLLGKQVEMSTIKLIGLKLNLARAKDGKSNWDDLAGGDEERDHDRGERGRDGGDGLAGLAIGGVEIRDAALVWDDRQAGSRSEIKNVTLTTGAINPGSPVDLNLGFDVVSSEPPLQGRIELAGRISADPAAQRFTLAGAKLTAALTGAGVPGNKLDATLNADFATDLAKQVASVNGLSIGAYGLAVTGQLDATGIQSSPKATGQLAVAEFDLATLVANLGIALPDGVKADQLGKARLEAEFQATDNSAEIGKFLVNVAGGSVSGSARVKNFADPAITGKLAISDLNPKVLIAAAGQALVTADDQALTRLGLTTDFGASRNHVELDGLIIKLDQSTLNGALSVKNFARPAVRFNLALDELDADRYLPPPAETAAAPTPQAVTGELPLEQLRALDLDGVVKVSRLKAYNLRSQNIELRLTANQGQLRVNPARAEMYDGRYQGNIGLDVRGAQPQLSLNEQLTGVQVGPLLKDLTGQQERLTGKTQASARLTATGVDPAAVKASLNGTTSFAFTDGAIKGFNLAKLIRDAYARFKGQPVPADDAPQQTDFSELSGSANIKEGLVDNRDLLMNSPLLRIKGAGTADLQKEQVDYRVEAAVVGSLQGQGGAEIKELKGVTVPVKITGSFNDPKFGIDMAALLTEQVRQKAKEQVEKQIEKSLGDKLPGGFKLPFGR